VRHPRRWGSAAALAVVCAGLTGLTACTGGSKPSAAGSPSAPTTTPEELRPTPTVVERDSYDACGGWDGTQRPLAYSPDSPPYTGPGPHRIALLQSDETPKLPDAWGSTPAHLMQLVVCENIDDAYKSVRVGSCSYDGTDGATTATVESARYIFRVYEARTARLVTSFTLKGATSPSESCPGSAMNPSSFFQLVKSADLVDRLRPLVEGAAPARSS
jgi:hypothetical protein